MTFKELLLEICPISAKVAHHQLRFTVEDLQAAHRSGWEQGKREAFEIARTTQIGYIQTTIAAMEYKEKAND